MKKTIKRYKFAIALVAINLIILAIYPSIGIKSFSITWSNTLEMLSVVPPIFVLLGLLDVWVQRETMIKLMGEKSGFIGILLAFLMGSVAAGPLYASFPIAAVLLKKGSRFSNVIIFVGAWTTTKIPLLLFETSAMGLKFMITRFLIDIPVVILIAVITDKLLNANDKKQVYDNAIAMEP
ncbi:MAG: permease [Clostridia bacterium]|jgi:uncharacterized membrane protein YraQ (UPF0718 family)